MLHILLMILKIIGIVLLTICLTVLFVPIRYRIKGKKDRERMEGRVQVSWLFGIVVFAGIYKEKKVEKQLRLFGVNLLNVLGKIKKRKADKLEKKADTKKKEDTKNEEVIKNQDCDYPVFNMSDFAEEVEKEPFYFKLKVLFEKIAAVPVKIIQRIRKIKLTIKSICDKIRYWKEFLADEITKDAIWLIRGHLIKMLKHILPKKAKGQIVYGFEDPCTTGQVLAGISVIYPVYYKHLTIQPDFTEAVFYGNVDLKGRIYPAYMLRSVLAILINENVRHIIYTFRNKEES